MDTVKKGRVFINRIIIFGIGNRYHQYISYFKCTSIVALLDNSPDKIGTIVDGVKVYSPESIAELSYDRIYILGFAADEMTDQLISLGVNTSDIYYFYDIAGLDSVGTIKPKTIPVIKDKKKSIVVISDDLKLSGAQSVMIDAIYVMKHAGYEVIVSSPVHGGMEKYLKAMRVPLVIDERIAIGTLDDIEWVKSFSMIFVNTVTFFHILLRRDMSTSVFLWLHEPELLYGDKFRSKIKEVPVENLYVYAVSRFAADPWEKYSNGMRPKILTVGRHDVEGSVRIKSSNMVSFIMIGSIGELKGQDVVNDALELIDEEYIKNISLRIIGRKQPGYDYSFLNKWIDSGVIAISDEMPREELDSEYEKSDVLICASKAESLSAVVIEAMQHRVPSIVSDTSGVVDYLENGENALVFQSENAIALADHMKWCVDNRKELRNMGKRARKVYEEFFTIDTFERNMIEAIDNVFQTAQETR